MLTVLVSNFIFSFRIFSKLETCSFPIKIYFFHSGVLFSFNHFLFKVVCIISKFLRFSIPFIIDIFRIIFKVLYIFQGFLLLKIVELKLLTGTFDLCYFFSLYHLNVFFVHMPLKEIESAKLEENNFRLNFKVFLFFIVVHQSFSFLKIFSSANVNFIILLHCTIIVESY